MTSTNTTIGTPTAFVATAARTSAQREARDNAIAALRAELAYEGRGGGELLRLERLTDAAWEAARRTGLAMADLHR